MAICPNHADFHASGTDGGLAPGDNFRDIRNVTVTLRFRGEIT